MNLPDTIKPLVDAGFAIHWLHPREKRPIGDDWQKKPVSSFDALRRRYLDGYNVGVRLGEFSALDAGYLHVIDLDIRAREHAAAAWSKLAELFPGVDFTSFPTVQSGSGGESRHIYFITDRPFRSRKIARSPGFDMVFDAKKGRDVRKQHWEIEVFGGGKQVAMPPSIHPDTGLPYSWIVPFDLEALEFGGGPIIPSDAVVEAGATEEDDEDFAGNTDRLGLTLDESRAILATLAHYDADAWVHDRDGWRNAGMALKHEHGEDGFDLWVEFSKQSSKFDMRVQKSQWKSFKGKTNRPVRMATLRGAARDYVNYTDADEFDDLDDEPATDVTTTASDDFEELSDAPKAVAPADDDWNGGELTEEEKKLNWTSLLARNEEGKTIANLHNLRLIVENDVRTRDVVAFNEFTQDLVQRGTPRRKKQRENAAKPTLQLEGGTWKLRDPVNGDFWTEDKDNEIRAIIEAPGTQGGYGIKVPDRDLRAAIDIVGRKNRFHPVREYLSTLSWDGRARVDTLFINYLGSPDDAYSRAIARLMMVAAVARVHEPGLKFDFAVILKGLQGKRKSTFIAVLAKNWFAELEGSFEDPRAMVEAMQGAWLLEMPELGGFVRADVRHIKAFISRRSDKVRLAYAKRAQEYHRQCVFWGSTNDDRFLKDDTGNRRFWPVDCAVEEIDTERLEGEIDQIWAEAFAIYQQMRAEKPGGGLPLYLADEEAKNIAARLQESARVESADDAVAGQIAAWLDAPINSGSMDDDFDDAGQPVFRNETCLIELWVECMGKERGQYGQQVAQMLGRAMSRLLPDWQADGRFKVFAKWGRQRVYDRGGTSARLERMSEQ